MVTKSGGTSSQSKSGGSAAGKTVSKAPSSSGGGGSGGYTGLKDMFDGGGPGRSGTTFQGGSASGILNALGVKPMGGSGASAGGGSADSGQAALGYSPFSFKGLTSTDAANVARNRAGAALYSADAGIRRDTPQAPLKESSVAADAGAAGEAPPEKPPLYSLGAPTMAPVPTEIPTPVYGLPSLTMPNVSPGMSYGSAFAPMANPMAYPYINLMDIFGAYPAFLPRA